MSDILFVSDPKVDPELELVKREIIEAGFSISQPYPLDAVAGMIESHQVTMVLINAIDQKFEAYDFCLKLKALHYDSLKIFVYLQDISANEASKFGKLDAEVIDASSAHVLIESLKNQAPQMQILKQDLTSIVSLDGGLGASTLAVLIAEMIADSSKTSLLMESNNKFSLREILGLEGSPSFLGRDRSLEHRQTHDHNWFSAFLRSSQRHAQCKYLNLFSDLAQRAVYTDKPHAYSLAVAEALLKSEAINTDKLKLLSSSLKLMARDIQGDPAVLFDELIKFSGRLVDYTVVDLGQDTFSSLNKQFLALSKNLVVLFSDRPGVKNNFGSIRSDLEHKCRAKLIPVLVLDEVNYYRYEKFSQDQWQDLLGIVPMLYCREPELISAYVYDQEALPRSSRTYKFLQRLLCELAVKVTDLNGNPGGAFKLLKYV